MDEFLPAPSVYLDGLRTSARVAEAILALSLLTGCEPRGYQEGSFDVSTVIENQEADSALVVDGAGTQTYLKNGTGLMVSCNIKGTNKSRAKINAEGSLDGVDVTIATVDVAQKDYNRVLLLKNC